MGSLILWVCVIGAAAAALWKLVLEPRRAARAWKEEGEEVYLTTARRLARHTVARVGAEPPEK